MYPLSCPDFPNNQSVVAVAVVVVAVTVAAVVAEAKTAVAVAVAIVVEAAVAVVVEAAIVVEAKAAARCFVFTNNHLPLSCSNDTTFREELIHQLALAISFG